MITLNTHAFDSPVGRITVMSSEKGLCFLDFPGPSDVRMHDFVRLHFKGADITTGGKVNKEAERQLKAYFAGKLKKFTVRLDLKIGGFYGQTLKHVFKIPFGVTKSYGQIAAELGNPLASRAVGSANRNNPIPIIIPCHRVLAANGLGGYGGRCGNLATKKKLLRHEGVDLAEILK
jgi:methylated-DNA-[protein]-cysteine S-methyltransferase